MREIIDPQTDFTQVTNFLTKEGHVAKMGLEAYAILSYVIHNREYPEYKECSASQTTLGEKLGIHRNTVGKKIQLLAQMGYLKVREEKVGFKTRQYLSVGNLPILEETVEKPPKMKRDTTKATAARQEATVKVAVHKEETIRVEAAQTEDKLYSYYLTLWAKVGVGVDKYSPESLRRSKKMVAAIEKYGEERVTQAYAYAYKLIQNEKARGVEFKKAREYIFNPAQAVTDLEAAEKAAEAATAGQRAQARKLAEMQAAEEARRNESDRKTALRPVATDQLHAEGILSDREIEFLQDKAVSPLQKSGTSAWKAVNLRVRDLYNAESTLATAAD